MSIIWDEAQYLCSSICKTLNSFYTISIDIRAVYIFIVSLWDATDIDSSVPSFEMRGDRD